MPTPDFALAPLDDWLQRLSAPVPDPGGGMAAGVVVATGAALVAMAAGYAQAEGSADVVAAATRVRDDALAAAEHDGRMSGLLVAAFRRPLADPGRGAALRAATVQAAEAGVVLVALAASLDGHLRWLERFGEPRLAPDVAVAGRMLACGIRSTAVNLRGNTASAAEAGADALTVHRLRDAIGDAQDAAARLDALAERVTASL
ncbi:cyclodeaminase/cyclohydrolase family protein [Microbacterium dauci]|uniref:Cyclodeaminase/cyclohydrolase family protein n=1 Tax=Microbacterium dauci TaxID=3048008 RepID=A0ABT6ZAB6_9MICO|nr:cyclodeaminase/cyclohydrolase family protein [Microbacterium sp. LX3-4]MDJ1113108.1 cyclodeaminase/cyclohydrolase family protein [Microbacterium sp. LX3-4]